MLGRFLHLMAIILLLSACAGPRDHRQTATSSSAVTTASTSAEGRQQEVEPASQTARHHHDYHDRTAHHYPDGHEPGPEEIYAGEIALIISAQIFACAFVVVILDGACDFYLSTGGYYY